MKGTVLLIAVAGLSACGGEKRAAAPAADSQASRVVASNPATVDSLMARVIPAAAAALALQSSPASADSILAANNFTLDRYEATLYSIAADSAASQLFESALGH
jgi:hypothetical protein